jgi:hypothetical protein
MRLPMLFGPVEDLPGPASFPLESAMATTAMGQDAAYSGRMVVRDSNSADQPHPSLDPDGRGISADASAA